MKLYLIFDDDNEPCCYEDGLLFTSNLKRNVTKACFKSEKEAEKVILKNKIEQVKDGVVVTDYYIVEVKLPSKQNI